MNLISHSGQDTVSLKFKAFVMFVTFLLFQSNLYAVLAHGKGPKKSVHGDFFITKKPKQKTLILTELPKCLKNLYCIYSKSWPHSSQREFRPHHFKNNSLVLGNPPISKIPEPPHFQGKIFK